MSMIDPATPRGRLARQRAIRTQYARLESATAVERILAVIAAADDDTVREGVEWYARAHHECVKLSARYGVPLATVVGIVAALSPQTTWKDNLAFADDQLAGRKVGHYSDSTDKADRIQAGANPTDVLGGRKVKSFYANILRPHTAGAVTVDRHAVSIAWGDVDVKILERAGVYQATAAAYRTVARMIGVTPHQCQAIAWVQHRKAQAITWADPTGWADPLIGF